MAWIGTQPSLTVDCSERSTVKFSLIPFYALDQKKITIQHSRGYFRDELARLIIFKALLKQVK